MSRCPRCWNCGVNVRWGNLCWDCVRISLITTFAGYVAAAIVDVIKYWWSR